MWENPHGTVQNCRKHLRCYQWQQHLLGTWMEKFGALEIVALRQHPKQKLQEKARQSVVSGSSKIRITAPQRRTEGNGPGRHHAVHHRRQEWIDKKQYPPPPGGQVRTPVGGSRRDRLCPKRVSESEIGRQHHGKTCGSLNPFPSFCGGGSQSAV